MTRTHFIAAIRFGPKAGPSSASCTCGATFAASSPNRLDRLWRAHKRNVGEGW